MKLPVIVVIVLALLFGMGGAFGAQYEQKRFLHPRYQGYRLDWCQEGACGGSPADAWCRWKGYDSAFEFGKAANAPLLLPTKAMASAQICRECSGFEWIVCERFGDRLRSAMPCLHIGNSPGPSAPACQGEQGHRDGAAAISFRKGEKVWILLRLRNLRPGKHLLTTSVNGIYERIRTGSVEWSQKIPFSNAERNWWFWYASKTSDPGEWTEYISIDGERIGYVEYSVSDDRKADAPASSLWGLGDLFGL